MHWIQHGWIKTDTLTPFRLFIHKRLRTHTHHIHTFQTWFSLWKHTTLIISYFLSEFLLEFRKYTMRAQRMDISEIVYFRNDNKNSPRFQFEYFIINFHFRCNCCVWQNPNQKNIWKKEREKNHRHGFVWIEPLQCGTHKILKHKYKHVWMKRRFLSESKFRVNDNAR